METIKFKTWDSEDSTFTKTFNTYGEAKQFFDKRHPPFEECDFGLSAIIPDGEGGIIDEKEIIFGECVEENGKIVEKFID